MVNSKKKQKKVEPFSPNQTEEGDAWIYTSIKRKSYFWIALKVGKWTRNNCDLLVEKVQERLRTPNPKEKLTIYTDGNRDYVNALGNHFANDSINYGQLIKIRERGRLIGKGKRIIYGKPDHSEIETSTVENFNGILRERLGRLVRRSKTYSKSKRRLELSLHLFQFYWNFMNKFKRNYSPAMIEGIIDKRFTWRDLFCCHLTIVN